MVTLGNSLAPMLIGECNIYRIHQHQLTNVSKFTKMTIFEFFILFFELLKQHLHCENNEITDGILGMMMNSKALEALLETKPVHILEL